MAVYGFGFKYNGHESQLKRFLSDSKVCTDWPEYKKYFHEQIRRILPGDLVFLKTFKRQGQTLRIYAVGIVRDFEYDNKMGEKCIKVEWFWSSEQPFEIREIKDGCISRTTTVYEEINKEVIQKLIGLMKTNMKKLNDG